jgi:hypothetical protein
MITANHMMSTRVLSDEFKDDEFAMGALDAPEAISTGSHRKVKVMVSEYSLPSCMLRDYYCWN